MYKFYVGYFSEKNIQNFLSVDLGAKCIGTLIFLVH
jgi:hypothetical protein